MNNWKIFLKYSDSELEFDKELELIDAKSYFKGYISIKRSYFQTLFKTIKMTKKYSTRRVIEKVLNPDNEDWTYNPWMLIIAKDNEKNKPFWFFIKREKDLSGKLVAIGPKSFAVYNNSNSDAKREIKSIMNYIIVYLNKFKIWVLLPNFLPKYT